MKILSYNINGIRAALKKGLVDFVKEQDPDIACFQETKCQDGQVDISAFEKLGYTGYWHSAVKKGYSGVLTLTKKEPSSVNVGMGNEEVDVEGRILRTDIEGWSIFNCYFPSGSSSEERHGFKLKFLELFKPFMEEIKKENKKIIILGDYNIVHTELDIHNPTRKDKPSGYRPEERQWMSDFFDNGFVDSFRYLNPETIEFSWWSYRAGSRDRNKGWRIDYIAVSEEQKEKIRSFQHFKDEKHSDHCGLIATIDS